MAPALQFSGPTLTSGDAGSHTMRSRDQILANLETAYREQYTSAAEEHMTRRMEELDAGYLRDQLMLEVLLDVRDLLSRGDR